MPRASVHSIREGSAGYQLRHRPRGAAGAAGQGALARLSAAGAPGAALGPLADALNEGQVYVTLTRLEKAGLVSSARVGQADRPDRKVYELTRRGPRAGDELA